MGVNRFAWIILVALLAINFAKSDSAMAADWTFCAKEHQTCDAPPGATVRYGAKGKYVYREVSGGTPCSNKVFGDPAYGVLKQCHYRLEARAPSADWAFCAKEHQTCNAPPGATVRYGAKGKYVYRKVSGGTPCSNKVFGDPAYGVLKQCHYRLDGGAGPSTKEATSRGPVFEVWNRRACRLTGTATIHLKRSQKKVTRLVTWYRWASRQKKANANLSDANGNAVAAGSLRRGSCDPNQRDWCEGVLAFNRSMPAGTYYLQAAPPRICQNGASKGQGFVRVFPAGGG